MSIQSFPLICTLFPLLQKTQQKKCNIYCYTFTTNLHFLFAIFLHFITDADMVLDDEDIKGNRANSYSEFIELASELLSTKIKDVILQASLDMENYVVEIDGADSVLY